MTQPYIGEIRSFGFNFAPRMYMFCNGQLLSIAQYTALFSILGTTYGGDGRVTFALPNLQGRIPMHWGPSSSGLNTVIGETAGSSQVTLLSMQLPAHNHKIVTATPTPAGPNGKSPTPSSTSYLSTTRGSAVYVNGGTANEIFSPRAISPTGGSAPHDNMQPYLTVNFCIAYEGIYPSRN